MDNLEALSQMIETAREKFTRAQGLSLGDGDVLLALDDLRSFLNERYGNTGAQQDLEECIGVAEQILELADDNHPERAKMWNNLAMSLVMRSNATASLADINRAIEIYEEILKRTPPSDPSFASYSLSMGTAMAQRSSQTGNLEERHQALQFTQNSVDNTPEATQILQGRTDAGINRLKVGAERLTNLSIRHSDLFSRLGSLADLNQSISILDKLLAIPIDHVYVGFYVLHRVWLRELSAALSSRYDRTNNLGDLDRSIALSSEALKGLSEVDLDRDGLLSTLGTSLGKRYVRLQDPQDLSKAMECVQAAGKTNGENFDQTFSHLNAAMGAYMRFEETASMDELDHAITILHQAEREMPPGHPMMANVAHFLGVFLSSRFKKSRRKEDRDTAIMKFLSALTNETYTPMSRRIVTGRYALDLCSVTGNWPAGHLICELTVPLISKLTIRSLADSDKQEILSDLFVDGLARDAAAVALSAGKGAQAALDVLEQGRGAFAASIEEMRIDVSALRQKHPMLAQRFDDLRELMGIQQGLDHYNTSKELDQVLEAIRREHGFQDFLLSSSENAMRAAAARGPIAVINVSEYRCDAFLITQDQVRGLSLPDLTQADLERRAEHGHLGHPHVLEWLWDTVACPILQALGLVCTPSQLWPHVWWVPTGILSKFPLHAAGYHSKAHDSVLDRAVSSYSSSIKAIIHGRQQNQSAADADRSDKNKALLVAVPETPEWRPLVNVLPESEAVRSILQSLEWTIDQPVPCKRNILTQLPSSQIFHFAGHGATDVLDPSMSSLILKDWQDDRLRVADLLKLNLRESSPFLAYLSACGTSRIEKTKYLDESIHLISAFQLAGFRHVVGTLWSVNDAVCVKVAKAVFEAIGRAGPTDESVPRGLHFCMRDLRNEWVKENQVRAERRDWESDSEEETEPVPLHGPPHWVPYVHFGV